MDLMLDDDVLELVLRHLDLFHLPAAASVARRWNAIVDGTHVASGTWFCGSDHQLRGMRRLVRRKMAEDSHASRTWLRPLLYDVNNARVDTEEDPFVFHFDPSSPLTSVRMVNELMMRKRTESSHSPIQPSSTAARASRTHTDEPRFPARFLPSPQRPQHVATRSGRPSHAWRTSSASLKRCAPAKEAAPRIEQMPRRRRCLRRRQLFRPIMRRACRRLT